MKPEAEPGLEPEPDAPGALVPFDAEAAFVDAEAAIVSLGTSFCHWRCTECV